MSPTAALLARASLRFYRRHPAQLLLSVLGIVLGTGVVVAVMITNASASRAFALSSEALYGRATHQVLGADTIAPFRYAALRAAWPSIPMAPLIEGHVSTGDTVLTVVGIDPFAEAPFRRFGRGPEGGFVGSSGARADGSPTDTGDAVQERAATQLATWFGRTDAVLIAESTARRLGVAPGEDLVVQAVDGERTLRVVSTFAGDNPAAVDGLLIADIALAQALLGQDDRLDRIELILPDTQVDAFRDALPPTLRLAPASSRQRSMEAMTRGFRINLTAMSLLALVVGAFLIHNTMTFAVLQRRELFATLRITGLTSRQVLATVLAEALAIALVGSLIGIALGRGLAEALVRLTTRTINDLYFVLHVQSVAFDGVILLLGLALGLGASLVAAAAAATDAAATSPVAARQRSSIEDRSARLLGPLAAGGAIAMVLGAMLAALPVDSLIVGFGALMLLIVGYGVTVPFAVHRLARAAANAMAGKRPLAALAFGGVERNISRTGLAIAALAIAVSATFGVDIMIKSFRASVDDWLGMTLASDVYVSSPSNGGATRLLDASIVERARRIDGVAAVSSGRVLDIATDVGTIETLVLEPHADSVDGFEFVAGDAEAAWRRWSNEDTVLISEPLATKHALAPGDPLSLFTALGGATDFRIGGVFRDYASSHGKLMLSRTTYSRHWSDTEVGSLGIQLQPDRDATATIGAIRTLASAERPLEVQSGSAIREASLAVFDRTFEVTRVLRWLTVGVAFVGIFSALLALHLERAREFAVLRANGATRAQVYGLVMAQTGVMGLLAGVLALPLGWITAEVLIHVINVRSFGWRMSSTLPPGAAVQTLWLALLSATLAGLWPAWRLARANIAARLRDE